LCAATIILRCTIVIPLMGKKRPRLAGPTAELCLSRK
jgi:hypothetical protein